MSSCQAVPAIYLRLHKVSWFRMKRFLSCRSTLIAAVEADSADSHFVRIADGVDGSCFNWRRDAP